MSNSSPFLDQVRSAIRVRHYSIRTEQAYLAWIKQFILFNNKRHPADMGEDEVSKFCNYSAYPLICANSALEVLIYSCKLRPSALI